MEFTVSSTMISIYTGKFSYIYGFTRKQAIELAHGRKNNHMNTTAMLLKGSKRVQLFELSHEGRRH